MIGCEAEILLQNTSKLEFSWNRSSLGVFLTKTIKKSESLVKIALIKNFLTKMKKLIFLLCFFLIFEQIFSQFYLITLVASS